MSTFQHYVPIQGNLTADPELRFTSNGRPVAEFSVAFNPKSFNSETQTREKGEAIFMQCVAWGKLAESIAAHPDLQRGKAVVGYASMLGESWEDKNGGGRRSKVKYRVEAFGPDVVFYVDDMGQSGQSQPQAPATDPWAGSSPQGTQGGGWGQNPNAGDQW